MTRLTLAATGVVALFAFSLTTISARQPAAIAVDGDDIGGVVRSSKGAEAGVWVIAETKDLPTPFVRDRRHRRSGTLPAARFAEGELLGVRTRLRPG